MQVATAQQFGSAMLKAFGLEGQLVKELTLKLDVHHAVTLEVTRFAGVNEMERAILELSAYKVELTPATPASEPAQQTPHNYG